MGFLKLLFGAPFEMIGGIIKQGKANKMQKFALKQAIHVQQIQNVENGRIAEVEWNKASMGNSSWRDEWVTMLISMPLVLIFGPDAVQQQIADGFVELGKLPGWYISAVGLMIGSAFGYQKYTDYIMNRAYTLPTNGVES
jgi:hypothetical protein